MKKSKILGLLRAFCVVYSKMFGSTFLKRLLFKKYGRLDEYDVAISFSHDLNRPIPFFGEVIMAFETLFFE